ncbi:MAG: flagellar motor protein MotB [Pseudomonadota bacterium]
MIVKDKRPIVIIKKVKPYGYSEGHQRGSWKLAYADLATAMMAFFLLMWLIGSTTKAELSGIASYFNVPLKVAIFGGEGSGNSSTILPGGGADLSRSTGKKERADRDQTLQRINIKPSDNDILEAEYKKLLFMRDKVYLSMNVPNSFLQEYKKQVVIDLTPEGLRIQLIDDKNRPMFDLGKSQLLPHASLILKNLATTLNNIPFRISISGHTDSTLYDAHTNNYSNWELSIDRANAARREMILGGLNEEQILRVEGIADSIPYVINEPTAPSNRRISIVILNKSTEDLIKRNGNGLL